jgi:hypothetical protein
MELLSGLGTLEGDEVRSALGVRLGSGPVEPDGEELGARLGVTLAGEAGAIVGIDIDIDNMLYDME